MSGRREGAPAPSSRELARLCRRIRRRTAPSQEKGLPNRAKTCRSKPDESERSPHPFECICVECQRRRLQEWKSAEETRAAQQPSRTDSPKSSKSPRSRKSSKRSRSPEPGAGSPKSTKRSQSPEPSTSSSQASRHPPNRRQRPPAHKAGTRPPSSGYSRYRQPRRGSLFWHRTRWLAARLIIIATLVTAGVIGYHWYSGAPLGAAVEMMTEDYRLAAACPTESETVFDFLGRASYPDNDSRMSVRYPDGWEAQVCNGDLAYDWSPDTAEAHQPTQTVAPVAAEVFTPDAQATAIPEIRPTAEVPVRRSVATPPSVVEAESVAVSGMRVDDVTIDAKGLVRTVNILVTNVLDEECTGLVFNVDLLNAEGELVGHMTIGGSGPVPAGKQKKFEQRYVGNTVSEAIVAAITCEGTVASSIAPTPMPAATNTPAPPPTATNTPAPTLIPPPPLRHIEEKLYMLELINDERVNTGLNPVVLGDNAAAQLHAETALENCFSSHWGVDGLKPYMRYSLAGGYQSNGENGRGSNYCIKASDGYRANSSAKQEILEAMEGWMDSPGHRDNILDPWHKKVNIGLAWDRYNFKAYQHFEGDHVEYGQLPSIKNGVLRMSGTVKNGVRFDDDLDSGVQVYYDPPPHTLTKGQVARTYCYDNGLLVASLRQPLSGGWYYDEDEFIQTYLPCPDPYSVSANARAGAFS